MSWLWSFGAAGVPPTRVGRGLSIQRPVHFLLWQAAYSELVFRDELWPDFTREHLEESLAEFRRARRYGRR
jgi:undecaprenyl diphosphate synthase